MIGFQGKKVLSHAEIDDLWQRIDAAAKTGQFFVFDLMGKSVWFSLIHAGCNEKLEADSICIKVQPDSEEKSEPLN